MKLKKRIKRALAAFLREELLEYIDYNHNIPYLPLNERFNVQHIEFDTMIMERSIDLSSLGNNYEGPMILEREIQRCKEHFSRQVMEHIHVESQDLVSHEFAMRRSVKFILRVQRKKY